MKSSYAKLIGDKGFQAQVKKAINDYVDQNKNEKLENLYATVLENVGDESISTIHEINRLQATPTPK